MELTRGVLVLTLAVACGVACGPAGVADTQRPSAGCGQAPPATPGVSKRLTMSSGGLEREFLLHLPAGYDSSSPTPLLLDFHGYTGTGPSEEEYTGLSPLADEEGFIVIYPQGTGFETPAGQRVTSWNDLAGSRSEGPAGRICSENAFRYPHPPECGEPTPCTWATCHDDLGFIADLLDLVEGELCIDLERVYASGMSNGGMFTHRLGCDMADRFAAIAPVGGTMARGYACAPDLPTGLMNINGANDGYVSQRGDMSSDGYYYEAATRVLATWAEAQGCDSNPTPFETSRDGTAGLVCWQHANCESGAKVVHCDWDGAHDWPQEGDDRFGNQIIWEFLSQHRRTANGSAE